MVPGLMDPHIQPPAVYLRFNRSKTRSMGPTLSLPPFSVPATTTLLVESQTQETLLISPCPLRLTHLNNQKVPLELPPKYFLNLPIYCLLSLHCPLLRANRRPHCSGLLTTAILLIPSSTTASSLLIHLTPSSCPEHTSVTAPSPPPSPQLRKVHRDLPLALLSSLLSHVAPLHSCHTGHPSLL